MTIDRFVDELWAIKGDRHITDVAREANINSVTLWRIMHRERTPSGDIMAALMNTYPRLARIFLSDNVPSGTPEIPVGAAEPA